MGKHCPGKKRKEFTGLLEKQEGMSCSALGRVEEKGEGKSTEQPPHYITKAGNMQQRAREDRQRDYREPCISCTYDTFLKGFSPLITSPPLPFLLSLFRVLRPLQEPDSVTQRRRERRERELHELSEPSSSL